MKLFRETVESIQEFLDHYGEDIQSLRIIRESVVRSNGRVTFSFTLTDTDNDTVNMQYTAEPVIDWSGQ